MLDKFIKELEKEIGLENPLEADMPGVYTLPLEEDLSVTLRQDEQGIVLFSILSKCPTLKREEFLQEMLHANLFGQGTEGASLGLSDEGDKITLNQLIDYDCSYEEFTETLEDFINAVDFWVDEAKTFK